MENLIRLCLRFPKKSYDNPNENQYILLTGLAVSCSLWSHTSVTVLLYSPRYSYMLIGHHGTSSKVSESTKMCHIMNAYKHNYMEFNCYLHLLF